MLLLSVSPGSALNILEKVKMQNSNVECGHKAYDALLKWFMDSFQKLRMLKYYKRKLSLLLLDMDTSATNFINHFERYVRKLKAYSEM